MTDNTVTKEPVSEQEPVSGDAPKGDEPKGDEPKSELTEERVQQLIAEATTKAVTEAKDAGRRELQSEQDRNKDTNRNAESRARLAESRVKSYETSFSGLDEDTQKDIELARYREQEKYDQSTAKDETQRHQEASFYQRLNESVLSNLDSLGIPRDDKRIDWGQGSQDYVEARARLDVSVAKILNESKKVSEDKMKDDFKNLESSLRKELNLDSVDTTASASSGSDSDADFSKGIGDGRLPLNKVNMERARKLGLTK